MDKTLVFHLGGLGSIPGLSPPFVPILLDCIFLPFRISRHFTFAADSRFGNQSFGKVEKKVSTTRQFIMANLIYIYNLVLANKLVMNLKRKLRTMKKHYYFNKFVYVFISQVTV